VGTDIRYAIRTLLKTPALTAVIVLSLGIGIGANTAIFSVVNALLLRPLPYPDPDRLAVLWLRSPGVNIPQDWPSPGEYIDIQNGNHSFEEISISQGRSGSLGGLEKPEQVEGLRTSSGLFHLLGARPLLGRLLLPEEDKPGHAPIAILSYALWQRLFHSDPNIVGKSVTLYGFRFDRKEEDLYTVAGVLEPEFQLNDELMPTVANIRRMEIFLPLPLAPDAVNNRLDENYNLVGRLKPGVSMAQAQADIATIAGRIREKDKRDRTFTISVVPALDQVVGNVRRAVLVLLGSVALVLLIACVNVANLLLSRASVRQKEVAIRTALGASRFRLMRQMLTESLLLGLAGGAAGLLVARWSLDVVRALNPGNIPRLEEIVIDGRVLAFTFGVSILTGIVFGIVPALRAARVDLNTTLKVGGRSARSEGGIGSSRQGMRRLLVVAELAISLMLLVGAGLLIRSFTRLQSVSPGFTPDHVISMRLGPGAPKFQGPGSTEEFWRRIESVPGVKVQGSISVLPFTPSIGWGLIQVEGFQPKPGEELQADLRWATPDYFRAMGIPLIKGRFFDKHDFASGVGNNSGDIVALIDEKFARRFWPAGDAIGKHIGFDPKNQFTIVGIVGTMKQYGLDVDGKIVAYFRGGGDWLVARTAADPATVVNPIVREIHAMNPTVPIYDVRTMDGRIYDSLARQRFATVMLGAFSAFALMLAIVGIYGVMSYLVTQGTHDIGLRIALGARGGDILGLVVRQGMVLAGIGIVLGVIGSVALTRVMASLLYGVSARDALTFTSASLILALVALWACFFPARRATKIDPITALREE
jgi:predicted permease